MDIKELQERAYSSARKRGLYASNVSENACISRICEEMYEMVKAYSNNEIADREYFEFSINRKWFKVSFRNAYEDYIKNTVQDEFADVIITIASVAQHYAITLTGELESSSWRREFPRHTLHENTFAFVKNATRTHRKGGAEITFEHRLNFLYTFARKWAETMGIDIDYFVELKLKYNELRKS